MDKLVHSGEHHADILRYPGRPHLLTAQNNSNLPKTAVMEYIPPVQTSPCPPLPQHDFQAKWNETLAISAHAKPAKEKNPVLLFEVSTDEQKLLTVLYIKQISQSTASSSICCIIQIIQQPLSFSSYHKSRPGSPTSRGCELMAWAFLKLEGSNGAILGDLRLQLYHYSNHSQESK